MRPVNSRAQRRLSACRNAVRSRWIAKAEFEASYKQWKAWAKLEE